MSDLFENVPVGTTLTDVLTEYSVFNADTLSIEVKNLGPGTLNGVTIIGTKDITALGMAPAPIRWLSPAERADLTSLSSSGTAWARIDVADIKIITLRLSASVAGTISLVVDADRDISSTIPKTSAGEIDTS